jgi:cardiolipin synthase
MAKKEKIYNIPNAITLMRVSITFIILYLIFQKYPILQITILFVLGMLTDALDGYIARKYRQKTEFGRKFDIIADRFLLLGTVAALVISSVSTGYFRSYDLILVGLILTREIIALPSAIFLVLLKLKIPHVRMIGKLITVLQAISFPRVMLKWKIALYFVLLTSILGLVSAFYFIYDSFNAFKQSKYKRF